MEDKNELGDESKIENLMDAIKTIRVLSPHLPIV
jgi:hypothetical protein